MAKCIHVFMSVSLCLSAGGYYSMSVSLCVCDTVCVCVQVPMTGSMNVSLCVCVCVSQVAISAGVLNLLKAKGFHTPFAKNRGFSYSFCQNKRVYVPSKLNQKLFPPLQTVSD